MLSMMSSIRLQRKSQRNALREVTTMRYSAVKRLGVVIAELADATALTLIVVTSKITTVTVVDGAVVAEAVIAAEVIMADADLAVVVNQLL